MRLRLRMLLVNSLLVSIQSTSIQRMSNLALTSPANPLASHSQSPLPLPTPLPPLITPLFPTCTTYYQLCTGGGGGGVLGIYIGGGVPWHTKKRSLRCGHCPKSGVLVAGTAPKKVGLRCGYNQKNGVLVASITQKRESCSNGGLIYLLYSGETYVFGTIMFSSAMLPPPRRFRRRVTISLSER